MSIEHQRDYYTQWWSKFEYVNQIELDRLAAVIAYVARIKLAPNPAICDLGCGRGWSTNILGMVGPATGVDLADMAVVQERYPHCRFVSANALTWDGPQSHFDVVVSIEVLEHIESESQGKFIRITHGILKPGGYLILTTPNKRTMDAIKGGGRKWSNQPVEDWVTLGQLRELLDSNGFDLIARTSVFLGVAIKGTYRIANSVKLQMLLSALGLGRAWERFALWANYGMHMVVLARKK